MGKKEDEKTKVESSEKDIVDDRKVNGNVAGKDRR